MRTASMGAAVALFCRGNLLGVGQVLPPHLVRWPFTICPNVATFGRFDFPVQDTDHLLCQITGGTNGQAIQATAIVEQSLLSDLVL